MKYLVFQVGCIECGFESYPIRVCDSLEEARAVADAHPSAWDIEGGEGYVEIIDLVACKNCEAHTARAKRHDCVIEPLAP